MIAKLSSVLLKSGGFSKVSIYKMYLVMSTVFRELLQRLNNPIYTKDIAPDTPVRAPYINSGTVKRIMIISKLKA